MSAPAPRIKRHWNYSSWTAWTTTYLKHDQLLLDGTGTAPDWLATAWALHSRCTENSTADDLDEDSVLHTALQNKGKRKSKNFPATATARTGTAASSSTGFTPEAVAGLLNLFMNFQHAQNIH